jgi:hypothetical protein
VRRPLLGRLSEYAGGDEQYAFLDATGVVEAEQSHCDSGNRSARLNATADELKMIVPVIPTRVEQPLDRAGPLVDRSQVASLPKIAQRASVRQVVNSGAATMLLGNNVVDCMRGPGYRLRKEAVLATLARSFSDLTAQGAGDVRRTHGDYLIACR